MLNAEVFIPHELLHACPGCSQVLQRKGGGIGAVFSAGLHHLAFCEVTKPGVIFERTHIDVVHCMLFSIVSVEVVIYLPERVEKMFC